MPYAFSKIESGYEMNSTLEQNKEMLVNATT